MPEKIINKSQSQWRCRILQNFVVHDLLPNNDSISYLPSLQSSPKIYDLGILKMLENLSIDSPFDAYLCLRAGQVIWLTWPLFQKAEIPFCQAVQEINLYWIRREEKVTKQIDPRLCVEVWTVSDIRFRSKQNRKARRDEPPIIPKIDDVRMNNFLLRIIKDHLWTIFKAVSILSLSWFNFSFWIFARRWEYRVGFTFWSRSIFYLK